MRYGLLTDLGGLVWWLLIKFCKTNLEEEQSKDKWSRNIFFLIVIGTALGFIAVKFL
jgi:hypothetical protein